MRTDVYGSTLLGYGARLVRVECVLTNSLPSISIVGLGNKAIDESKERVRSAVTNSKLQIPRKRITINLAPADLPKHGSALDLSVAVAILLASKQIPEALVKDALFVGELSLHGEIRGVNGILGHIQAAEEANLKRIFIPTDNIDQATLAEGIDMVAVPTLAELYQILCGEEALTPLGTAGPIEPCPINGTIVLDDIRGQEAAKRALAICVAGQHNLLLSGPPGTGKTMLARAANSLLPPLKKDEIRTLTHLYSLINNSFRIIKCRPFRSPHHTASKIALVGGGKFPLPGEVSLATHGVLFLDELLEFPRTALETLRQPLEDGTINIVRTEASATYPAKFILIGALNPCPCGYLGDSRKNCTCAPSSIINYQKRLSGPLMDRFDLQVVVARTPLNELNSSAVTDSSSLHQQIISAWQAQQTRNPLSGANGSLQLKEILPLTLHTTELKSFFNSAADKLALSSRGYVRTLRVARTIADLEAKEQVHKSHLLEALSYRELQI